MYLVICSFYQKKNQKKKTPFHLYTLRGSLSYDCSLRNKFTRSEFTENILSNVSRQSFFCSCNKISPTEQNESDLSKSEICSVYTTLPHALFPFL